MKVYLGADDITGRYDDLISSLTTSLSGKANASDVYTKTVIDTQLSAKQDTLVSGTNIKTINGDSIVGEGNLLITASNIGAYSKSEIDEKSMPSMRNWIKKPTAARLRLIRHMRY